MSLRVCLCLVLAAHFTAAGAAAPPPQDRTLMSTEHAGSKATVMIIEGSATLRLEAPGSAARTIEMGHDWQRVSNVRFSPTAARLAIVSDADTLRVLLVDVAAGRVLATYPVTTGTVSPDGRAVIVEDASHRVALVPLNAPDDPSIGNLNAFYIHPQGDHVLQSDFYWTDPEVVAFIAFVGTEARVVALQVDAAGRIQKRGDTPLPVGELLDAAAVKDGRLPTAALAGVEITRVPSAGLTLRLQFPADPALRSRTTDVRLWE